MSILIKLQLPRIHVEQAKQLQKNRVLLAKVGGERPTSGVKDVFARGASRLVLAACKAGEVSSAVLGGGRSQCASKVVRGTGLIAAMVAGTKIFAEKEYDGGQVGLLQQATSSMYSLAGLIGIVIGTTIAAPLALAVLLGTRLCAFGKNSTALSDGGRRRAMAVLTAGVLVGREVLATPVGLVGTAIDAVGNGATVAVQGLANLMCASLVGRRAVSLEGTEAPLPKPA